MIFDLWLAVFWLTGIMLLGAVIKRWVMLYLHAVGFLLLGSDYRAIWLRFIVLAPGIFLHELSHWLTAKLLFVPTGKFSLGPSQTVSRGRHVQVTMGYVMIGRSDPVRSTLIGAAPFFFGTLAVLAVAWYGFGQALGDVVPPTTRMAQVVTHLPDLFRVPDAWLWLYLVFSVSNSLTPSESDRRGWLATLLYAIALGALVILFTGTREVPADVLPLAQRILDVLLFAFTLTLAIDVLMGALIYVLYQLISRAQGRRITFR